MTYNISDMKISGGKLKEFADAVGIEKFGELEEYYKNLDVEAKARGEISEDSPVPKFKASFSIRKYGRSPTFIFTINFKATYSPEVIEVQAPTVWNGTLKIRKMMVTNRNLRDKVSNNVDSVFVKVKGFESESEKKVSNSLIDYTKDKPEILSAKFINSEFPREIDLYSGRTPHKNNFQRVMDRDGTTTRIE